MEETSISQFLIFVFSCALGMFLSLIYDFFRIVKITFSFGNTAKFIQDVLYFSVSAVITFIFVLLLNSGEVRLYIIVGETLGWLVFHISVGKFICRVYKKAIRALKFKLKPKPKC